MTTRCNSLLLLLFLIFLGFSPSHCTQLLEADESQDITLSDTEEQLVSSSDQQLSSGATLRETTVLERGLALGAAIVAISGGLYSTVELVEASVWDSQVTSDGYVITASAILIFILSWLEWRKLTAGATAMIGVLNPHRQVRVTPCFSFSFADT